MALSVKFYGTRGQIMSVSRDRLIYGGHTSCMTVKNDDDMLIVDAGFGISKLASTLMRESDVVNGNNDYHLVLTHFHWDHIQGLQYFTPLYFKGNNIHVYSPFERTEVCQVLNLLLDGSYTPFNGLDSLPCKWHFHKLSENDKIGSFEISHHPTVHVGPCYAYRINHDNGSVVFTSDHDAVTSSINDSLVEWAKGCDILVHEAMFTPSEYSRHIDLGHSSFLSAMENARRIDAKLVLLTHHAPLRGDAELAEHERYLEKLYNTETRKLSFAREGVRYFAREEK